MSSKKEKKAPKVSIGGQALIEGVMMNGPKGAAIAVRNSDGEIITEMQSNSFKVDKIKFFKLPFVRGIVNFIKSMMIGYKSLMRSAELSGQLDEEEEIENMSRLDRWLNSHMGPKMIAVVTGIASVLAVVLGVGLFIFLPTYIVDLLDEKLLGGAISKLHPLFEGVMRMIIMILYMLGISKMKDIKRVFMYHGAEHKSIFCFEKGLELTVENIRGCKRFHPRCVTSFLFVILIISIIVSSVAVIIFPILNASEYRLLWMVIKIFVIIPVVTSISYEFIKYAGRHDNIFTKILSAPGLWMQRITTAEPDDSMIEVAIASIKAVIDGNTQNGDKNDLQ